MALVFVLWVMAILCAVALEVRFSSHLRMQVTASTSGSTKAFFLARAGVERAVAELVEGRDRVQSQADLLEGQTRVYQNVELGEGSYTLYVGTDDTGEPIYGIGDEAAKINVNTVEESALELLPGMDADLVAGIMAQREREELHDLNDLLLLENVDFLVLYGEDQNGNGLLDPNEDDGEETWPPDNRDGSLDEGLVAYLTTWSAARNVTAEGNKRVDLNSAGADEIVKSVTGITAQQADSIVAHRGKGEFATIADLLDVELIEKKTEEQPDRPDERQRRDRGPEREGPRGGPAGEEREAQQEEEEKPEGNDAEREEEAEGKSEGSREEDRRSRPERPDESERGERGERGQREQQPATQGTGVKAFDMATFRQIADLVTAHKDEVRKGVVNVNTASREVLACVPGIDEALARRIVQSRQGRSTGFQTEVDLLDLDGMTLEKFKEASPHISARSDVFSVRSFGVVGIGDTYCCVSAIIDRTENEAKIGFWRELE
jgi:competence ComEA-like helix-hairpin-helix protein